MANLPIILDIQNRFVIKKQLERVMATLLRSKQLQEVDKP